MTFEQYIFGLLRGKGCSKEKAKSIFSAMETRAGLLSSVLYSEMEYCSNTIKKIIKKEALSYL